MSAPDTRSRKRWGELSVGRRAAIVAAGTVQLALFAAALRDLRRRPARKVNGDKRLWVAACFVNFVGPIAYFIFGRKR
jgi:phospholipase D-like protein